MQVGPISARPPSYVYNPSDELRSYNVFRFEGGRALGLSFHSAPGGWELEAADEEAASQAQ